MKLFFFTSSYPYGLGEQWKANELGILIDHFESITVIPFSFGNNFTNPKPLPLRVKLEKPLFEGAGFMVKPYDITRIIFSRHVWIFFREFFSRRVYLKKEKLIKWVVASLSVLRLLKHPTILKFIQEIDSSTCLYFYWGKGACEILPFINYKKGKKTIVRMHRYDLFEYENQNYIPYRSAILNTSIIIAPSSEAGKRHLNELYPNAKCDIRVVRCGTKGNGNLSRLSSDQTLRVVSCSLLVTVKQVHIMIECMSFINFPILWYHIGEGPMEKELRQLVKSLNLTDKFIFVGMLDSRDVLNFYTSNCFDLFVNTSSSEGVPFSIMEALSVGIPIIATNVGGTGELVDHEVGQLIPADVNPETLAQAISTFYHKPSIEKNKIRKAAYDRYETHWNSDKLTIDLVKLLKN